MQRLSRSTLGRTRWWCPSLSTRRRGQLNAAASTTTLPTQQLSRLSLYGQQWRSIIGATYAAAEEKEGTWPAMIIPNCSHRDGSIYKNAKKHLLVDPTDREETQVEPMRFAAPNADCRYTEPDDECAHLPYEMLQVFSLKLARAPPPMNAPGGLVQLYGYIAARDDVDFKLNYIFRRGRDDPIAVPVPARNGSGSPIEMTGPKRAILFCCDVLLEFDMRIKNGDREEDDLQLIDGITEFLDRDMMGTPWTAHIHGAARGAVDMSLSDVCGFEATVEVAISEVGDDRAFDFSLGCAVSTFRDEAPHKEFQLFGGHVAEPCGLRRFVVAVSMETVMLLKLKAVEQNNGGAVSPMLLSVAVPLKLRRMDVPAMK